MSPRDLEDKLRALEQQVRELSKLVSNLPVRLADPRLSARLVIARVGAALHTGGVYVAFRQAGEPADVSADLAAAVDTLQMPEGMREVPADNAPKGVQTENSVLFNLEENNLTGHRLESGSYVVAVEISVLDQPPYSGSHFLVSMGGVGRVDSPTVLNAGGGSPDSTAWNNDNDGTPVQVQLVTGVFWDGSVFRVRRRNMLIDARGIVYSISAEADGVITDTSECTPPSP
jgi:hypothetical protein